MKRNSQISVYIILGMLFVFLLMFLFFSISEKKESDLELEKQEALSLSEMRVDIQSYMKSCIKDSVQNTISETGIGIDLIDSYKEKLSDNIYDCSNYLFEILEEQGYDIEKGEIDINIELDKETIFVDLNYPLVFKKDNHKSRFNSFSLTFDRSEIVKIRNGRTENQMEIISKDRRASILIPSGLEISDNEGNKVDYLGVRVEDLHFDNLENTVVVGKTIYEGFPDGAKFSEPIQISIEFDEQDIPEGYTKENIMISWWNKDIGIWFGVPTKIEGNRAIGVLNHFTDIAITLGQTTSVAPTVYADWLLPYRYVEGECDVYEENCRCAAYAWKKGETVLFNSQDYNYEDIQDLRDISDLSYRYEGQPINDMITYGFEDIDCEDESTYSGNPDLTHHIEGNDPILGGPYFEIDLTCIYPDYPDIPENERGSRECNGLNVGVSPRNSGNDCTCEISQNIISEGTRNFIESLPYNVLCNCKSASQIEDEEEIYGWNYKCFGATVTGPQGYIDEIRFMPRGGASFNPDSFFVNTVNRGGTASELLYFEDVEIDSQVHEKYPWRIVNDGVNPVVQIRGIRSENYDKDACASSGLIYTYRGAGRVMTDIEIARLERNLMIGSEIDNTRIE